MPRPVAPRPANDGDASAAAERSVCGLVEGSLSGGFVGGGMGLGHSDMLTRKRSLDNMENIPPFGLDGIARLAAPGSDRPTASLLDVAAQQLSQKQRKNRRTVITASSPGGHQRAGSNPRRATMLADASLLRSQPLALSLPRPATAAASATSSAQPKAAAAVALLPAQNVPLHQRPATSGRQTPIPPAAASGSGAGSSSSGARLRRLPKRNLKPLDFSGLHRLKAQPAHATTVAADGATAINKLGAHSSEAAVHARTSGTNILALPVSPAQSSPVSTVSLETLGLPESSPAIGPVREAPNQAHPTPPSTMPRRQPAFSGLLALAYRRATTKRSSKRALCFDGSGAAADGGGDEALQGCDPVLGPRCPVIGAPRGMFGLQKNGIDVLQREQAERTDSRFTEMARTVRQAQAQFEAAVAEQTRCDRPSGRKPGRPPNAARGRGRGKSAGPGALAAGGQRLISECKYCGKQYKYHAKLASHEQHCSSRLEALLYSADEHEQHTIHCVCGPRHERPVGERDDLPMVQCDNCLSWLHIECVDIDEDNLPEEFFCPRCESGFAGGPGLAHGAPSTPKRKPGRISGAGMMSPESHRLAALLADVPNNDGSETEEEPMCLRVRGQPRLAKVSRIGGGGGGADMSSEDTMSISDVAEVARFHRQGSATKRPRSPAAAPRLAQSESNISAAFTPSRRRPRSGIDGAQHMVHTDALSSDFLGLPLPESIFCERPNFVPGLAAPDLCSQQGSMADLSQFLAGSQQPQLSLAQLSSMLGAAAPPGTADLLGAGSSGYLEQALADFQFGLGGAGVPRNADADPSLPELVDIPADNEFSVLLDSFASGNPGTDADSYSSIGADDMFDVAPALVTAPGRGARMLGGRVGGGGGGFDVGHGSSSTITIMNDSGQDSGVGTSARWVGPRPAPARPPPGPPGIARGRGGKTKRSTSGLLRAGPSARSAAAAKPAPIVLSLPSNPPSATGVGDLDIAQLIGSASQPLLLDWPVDGDSLERELEGLIDFDA